jgi:hypothetical protein
MKADTSEPCDLCCENMTVGRLCIVSGHGELVDYTDLCPDCLRDAAATAGLQLGERLKKIKSVPASPKLQGD